MLLSPHSLRVGAGARLVSFRCLRLVVCHAFLAVRFSEPAVHVVAFTVIPEYIIYVFSYFFFK